MAALEPNKPPSPGGAPRPSPAAQGGPRAAPSGTVRSTGSHPKPILASEALMDDVAPQEPWRNTVRWWAAAAAVVLAGAAAVHVREGAPATQPMLWAGAALALIAAVVPMAYALRGLLLTASAGVAIGLAVNGHGPAAVVKSIGQWGLVHFVAASLLGAALFFRSRYRAYGPARLALAVALVAALPFAVRCGVQLARGSLPLQIASGVALASMVLALLGFTGSESTLGLKHVGALVIVAVCGELGVEMLGPHFAAMASPAGQRAAAALGAFAATTLLGALGVFQLLAWRNWKQARAVDVRKRVDDEKEPMPSMSGDPWSSEL
jgi:hypothetical protein